MCRNYTFQIYHVSAGLEASAGAPHSAVAAGAALQSPDSPDASHEAPAAAVGVWAAPAKADADGPAT